MKIKKIIFLSTNPCNPNIYMYICIIMNYKEFFTMDNKSGWKTRESILLKNEPKMHQLIVKYSIKNNFIGLPFKEQIWYFINDATTKKNCCGCGGNVEFRNSLIKGYRDFCSLACANINGNLNYRVIKSNQNKFGVDYYTQHEDFISKVKKTKLTNHGSENYNNQTKTKKTKLEKYGDENYNNRNSSKIKLREDFIEKIKNKCLDTFVKYELGDENIILNCSTCKNDYEIYNNLFNTRFDSNIKTCTKCNPIKQVKSIQQKELTEFISSLNIGHIEKDYTGLLENKRHLDIYVPNKQIAIEFNGLYFHSTKFRDKNYHLNKTEQCLSEGVQLLHIFEDEWMFKRDVVKSRIKNILGFSENRIYARKCEIKEVSKEQSKLFLNTNHIQGNVISEINLGLYYNDELVSIMTLSGKRTVLGSRVKEDGHYELLRFCNKLNTSVVGGAGKLFNHLIKNYQPKEIISYADRRWSVGNLYEKLGFEFIHNSKPNYFYLINKKREYRFKYRKDILIKQGYDANKTEEQIMLDRGILRIYDCGAKKYKFTF